MQLAIQHSGYEMLQRLSSASLQDDEQACIDGGVRSNER